MTVQDFLYCKKVNKSKSVEVIPEIYSMPVVITGTVRNFFGDADVYDDIRPGMTHQKFLT